MFVILKTFNFGLPYSFQNFLIFQKIHKSNQDCDMISIETILTFSNFEKLNKKRGLNKNPHSY